MRRLLLLLLAYLTATPVKSTELSVAPVVTALDTFWKTKPYIAAALTCGFKASTADLVAQNQQENEKIDVKRNVAYMIYGAVFQGMVQEFTINRIYPIIFGPGTSLLTIVGFNVLIWTTLVMLPTAYLTKAVVYGHSIKKGMQSYIDDIRYNGLLKKNFLLWTPAHFVTFGFIPEHWRITFIAVISFFWMIIFSSIASRPNAQKKGFLQRIDSVYLRNQFVSIGA